MTPAPRTIEIRLPNGDPHGIRVAEFTTGIVRVFDVPRSLLPDFLKTPDSKLTGVYFLVAAGRDDVDPRVYIGQTGDLRLRLNTHHREKDFWERVLVVVSRIDSLTPTHALFLEWRCLQDACAAGRYVNENGNSGSRPKIMPTMEDDCREIFDTSRVLLTTLGFPLFDPVASSTATSATSDVFFCKSGKVKGRGQYTTEGFVVLKGSVGRTKNSPALAGRAEERLRKRLIEAGVMRVDGDVIHFERDHLFGSPSMAASALLGRTANGWTEWKNEHGVTLDELKRPSQEAES